MGYRPKKNEDRKPLKVQSDQTIPGQKLRGRGRDRGTADIWDSTLCASTRITRPPRMPKGKFQKPFSGQQKYERGERKKKKTRRKKETCRVNIRVTKKRKKKNKRVLGVHPEGRTFVPARRIRELET